ncbi:5-methyltetrahydrofolate--homocysteine methyltransferase [Colwellia sp. 20A7]|uniref:5-methyltetrahydrofolate--homocysteine methyltransferase n=1 Tax=Colwellia sp. 20A7 TaxID=2689569 RepID=UPI00135C65FE|nr:5-methyltetrahydrofolate--homocysteine methyltransferase [Colwellia sp. 20A7]
MKNSFQLNLIAASLTALFLSGCGDAETNIVEKDSIEVPDDSDDHDHDDDGDDHDHGDEYTIESLGRLAVLSAESNTTTLYDLDDGDLLDTFSLIYDGNAITASAGYRFAVIASRNNDYVGFIDSGLWREDHVEHLHDYQQAPVMSDYQLNGSSPTHIIKSDDEMIIFNDGNADAGVSASVKVLKDTDISGETSELPHIDYSINMHGVALAHDEYLLSTVRRDDTETTSAGTLPDQVAVYHLHGNEYEQEQILDITCPDLHAASQNDDYVVFGCTDGVLVAHEHDGEFEAVKIANIESVGSSRIGSIYGHEESDSLIGVAADLLFAINPEVNTMEKLEWQLAEGVSAVSYAFSHEAEYFLVLDSAGYLNILNSHSHDGEAHWELATSIDISEEDISTMPEGMSFSMTAAQNGDHVYVADPIAKHILQIDLATMTIEDDIEIGFSASAITWLGIAEEAHDH